MACSTSFHLCYTKAQIEANNLHQTPVSIRCQFRYTRSHLTWRAARLAGQDILRLQFMLPVKAQPQWWRGSKVKHTHPNATQINNTIDSIAQRAISMHAQWVEHGFPSDEEMTIELLGGAQEAAKTTATTLPGYLRLYIQYLRDKNTNRTTVQRFEYIDGLLARFSRATRYTVDFSTINKTFAARFAAWAETSIPRRRKNQDMAKTVARIMKDMRNFLSHAVGEGWTTAATWRQIKPNLKPGNPFPITVNDEEIDRIAALTAADLSGKARHGRSIMISRDWFLLGTQTSLRWSDWRSGRFRFVPLPDDGGYNLQIIQEKTDDPLEIPLSTLAIEILRRYDFNMPPCATPSTTLSHLRIIARAAGISKHITTHTARRTFCTLQEAAGVPRSVIMRITGHRTEKDYLRYTGITFRYNADMMRRANPKMFSVKSAS